MLFAKILKELAWPGAILLSYMCMAAIEGDIGNGLGGAQAQRTYAVRMTEVESNDDYNEQVALLYQFSILSLNERKDDLHRGELTVFVSINSFR